jgi:predicted nucleic acid-binding protein
VRFWDTSAIVPLLAEEGGTVAATAEFERDPSIIVWWGTKVECVSALTRRERHGGLVAEEVAEEVAAATRRLVDLGASWEEIQPAERLRQTAERLLRTHPLPAGGAFQLAAAIVAADEDPRSLPFVTLDDRLARAAEREGFPVVEPA